MKVTTWCRKVYNQETTCQEENRSFSVRRLLTRCINTYTFQVSLPKQNGETGWRYLPRPPGAAEYPACVPPRRPFRCSPKYLGSILDSRPRKSWSTWPPFVAGFGTATPLEMRKTRTRAMSWTRSTAASVVVPTSGTLRSRGDEGSLPLPPQTASPRIPHGGNDEVRRATCGRPGKEHKCTYTRQTKDTHSINDINQGIQGMLIVEIDRRLSQEMLVS